MGTSPAHVTRNRDTCRGLGLPVALAAEIIRLAAIAAQDHGYASLWLNNPPGSSAIRVLSGVAQFATTIRMGVGVVPLSNHQPGDIVREVIQSGVHADRLYLGVGSGSGAGAVERVAEGVRAIRSQLECFLVIAALGPRMCRLAGAEADGVLLNWLTPQWAEHSIDWVRDGANRAGKRMPRVMAYVRVAVGHGAVTRLQREAPSYEAIAHYAAHFRRMGTPAAGTAVTGDTPGGIQRGLAAWDGVVNELIVRVIAAHDTVEEVINVVGAARPAAHALRPPPVLRKNLVRLPYAVVRSRPHDLDQICITTEQRREKEAFSPVRTIKECRHLGRVVLGVAADVLTFLGTALRSRTALAAENLLLRKRLA